MAWMMESQTSVTRLSSAGRCAVGSLSDRKTSRLQHMDSTGTARRARAPGAEEECTLSHPPGGVNVGAAAERYLDFQW